MNIVGIYKSTGRVFESQSYASDEEKLKIEKAIKEDAVTAGVEIEIRTMMDTELESLM